MNKGSKRILSEEQVKELIDKQIDITLNKKVEDIELLDIILLASAFGSGQLTEYKIKQLTKKIGE